MLSLILPFLSNLLPDVIKRVLPAEKMSDAERAALEQALTMELMKLEVDAYCVRHPGPDWIDGPHYELIGN